MKDPVNYPLRALPPVAARVMALVAVGAGVLSRTVFDMLVARLAGPPTFAVYAVLSVTATIVSVVAVLGLSGLANQVVPALQARSDARLLLSFERLGTLVTLGVGFVLGTLVSVALQVVPSFDYLGWNSYLLVVLTPAIAWLTFQRQLGLHSRRPNLALFGTAYACIVAFALTLVLSFAPNLIRYLGAVAFGYLFIAVLLRRCFLRTTVAMPVASATERVRWRDWLGAGSTVLSGNAATALTLQTDVMLVSFFASPSEIGAYALASRLSLLVTLGLAAVIARDGPAMGRHFANGGHQELWRAYKGARRSSIWLTVVPAALLIAASPALLGAFGADYAVANSWLALLIVGRVASGLTGPVAELLIVAGYARTVSAASWAGLVTTVLGILVLGSTLGVTGVACGTVLGTIVANGLQMAAGLRIKQRSVLERGT